MLIEQYRNADDCAGKYKKIGEVPGGGVAAALRDVGNQYGPSHAAFSSWKRSGIPTSEVLQSSVFGLATRKGDTAGDCFASKPTIQAPYRAPSATAQRVNPITWTGGPPEPEPRARHVDPHSGRPMIEAPSAPPPPPPPPQPMQPPPPQPLSPAEMQQTWSDLMRSGKIRPSAAHCMVEMPPGYSYEAPPPMPPVASHAINTIGLHPQHGGRPVRRNAAFTKDFRDPFM